MSEILVLQAGVSPLANLSEVSLIFIFPNSVQVNLVLFSHLASQGSSVAKALQGKISLPSLRPNMPVFKLLYYLCRPPLRIEISGDLLSS